MKKFLLGLSALVLALFSSVAIYLYFTQEAQIFAFPQLPQDYRYEIEHPHRHVQLSTGQDGDIHAILYESLLENPRGVIYYFHGKGSNLSHPKWQKVVDRYTGLGFDLFMIDYRGAGLSRGEFVEQEMLADCLAGYNYLLEHYPEEKITVYGKSLGTSFATFVASNTNPRALILEAPFYNLYDIACKTVPQVPSFIISMILKYPLRTDLWIQNVKCPIYLFHGTSDKVIPEDASIRLSQLVGERANLTIIEGGDHDHLYKHEVFNIKIEEALGLKSD